MSAFLLAAPAWLAASGEGPRVHVHSPVGVNVLVFNGTSLQDANRTFDPGLVSPFARYDTSILNIQYARTFEIADRHVTFLGVLRGGQTRRALLDEPGRASSSGLADPFFGFSVNLKGLPPMPPADFRQFDRGFMANLLLGVTPPLGEYDNQNIVNLGSNRWSLRVALPLVQPFQGLGSRYATWELIPNIYVYSENTDRQLKQNPLFTLEGHVTHDLSARWWVGIGFLYTYGGATSVRSVIQNGSQRSLALSLTAAMDISDRWTARFRYGSTIAQNEAGLKGDLYQVRLSMRF